MSLAFGDVGLQDVRSVDETMNGKNEGLDLVEACP